MTELQMLEQDVAILKTQLNGVENADPSSAVGPLLLENIKAKEAMDGFLVKEGGSDEVNQFHTAETPDGGCCVVM